MRDVKNAEDVPGGDLPEHESKEKNSAGPANDKENGRVQGFYTATGIRPKFMKRLDALGIELPPDVFRETEARHNPDAVVPLSRLRMTPEQNVEVPDLGERVVDGRASSAVI